ncbi:MAG: DNA recombination protein RmuC [Vulcanimicrobiaceae bacterium]
MNAGSLEFLLAGLAAGSLVTWLFARTRLAELRTRLEERSHVQESAIEALIERAKNEMRDATAARAGERVGDLVKPMHDQLTEFNRLIADIEKNRKFDSGQLKEAMSGLMSRTQNLELAASQLSTQTSTLVTALRNPTTRGRWGEMQLRNVLEKAGMSLHSDFSEQQTVTLDDGRIRPDMTVNLPGDRCIFVDAKAPIDAMQAALEAPDENERRILLKQYAKALQDHVDALARRNYPSARNSADFVILFVPGESFLSAACSENPLLMEYALDKSVLVTGPLALISLLRSFALGWQAVRQEENAKRIAAIGRELYERAQIFSRHLQALRKSLAGSVDAFNSAVNSYESRLLPQGRKLKDEAALDTDDELPEIGGIDMQPKAITALDATTTREGAAPPALFDSANDARSA